MLKKVPVGARISSTVPTLLISTRVTFVVTSE